MGGTMPHIETDYDLASTRLVGLIGWPLEHSLSPLMHNAAFDALGMSGAYLRLPVPPGQARAAVWGLAALGYCGANVTVPHKRAVLPALDSLSPEAAALGAVNTIVVKRDASGRATIAGHNTDARGFVEALQRGGLEPERMGRVVIVGAGGAARAVVYSLLRAGVGQIAILNRTSERAQVLADDLGRHRDWADRLRVLPLTAEALVESARPADLLVHTTVLGMWPHTGGLVWPKQAPFPAHLTVVDLVYNPLETRLLRLARQSGACGIDGLEMLVLQGALAFELWAGRPLDLTGVAALMRAACEQALRRL
jgi:shikimate dehydrogenase